MSTVDLFLVFTLILNLILGGFVLFNNRRNQVNISFALFTLGISGWNLCILLLRLQPSLLWGRLAFAFPSLIPASFVIFAHLFPSVEKDSKSKLILFSSVLALFFLIISLFSNLILQDISISQDTVESVRGPLYPLFSIYFLVFTVLAFYLLWRKYHKAVGVTKIQIKYIFVGILFFALFAIGTNLILPILGLSKYNTIGPSFSVVMIAAMAYSIIKHRLMDIRLAIRAGLVKLILIAVLTVIFVGLAFVQRFLLGEMDWGNGIVGAFSFAVFAAFFYSYILRAIRFITDNVLFQREYSHQELLRNLGKTITQSLNLNELLQNIEKTLLEVMRVSNIEFVLTTEGDNKDNLLLEQLRVNPEVLVYDELKREISEKPEGLIQQRLEKVVEEMAKSKAAVIVPLPSSKGIVGMVVLGDKKGGDTFTSSDIATLETLMYQAGIAIENASLFTQVHNFNRTLRLEIAEATADLSAKNKRLSVLRRLDEIIINTLELDEMAQKVTDVISWEMGFLGGILFLLDEGESLKLKAVSSTPALKKAVSALPIPLGKVGFDMNLDPSNFLAKAIKEKDLFASSNLADFLVPAVTQQAVKAFQHTTGIKHFVCYALSSKGKSLGVLLFGLHKTYNKIDKEEQELLRAFSEQAGIALENAKLYSDLKKANLELSHSYAQLKELDKMKDELVSISSHELRTPITAVKSYLWMALNKSGNLAPKIKKYLERAYESSDRMINLVNDMLSVSRLDAGRMKLSIKRLDLPKLITAVISELTARAQEKKIELTFEKSAKNMPKVLADEQMTREVLVNLLDNAIKFTPEKGKVTISLRRRGKILETLIADTGLGIAKEDLPKLFQKFGRLEHSFATMAESGGGTGLGLYIAKNIINLHRGKIWVRSKVGKGSTFIFSLRIAE